MKKFKLAVCTMAVSMLLGASFLPTNAQAVSTLPDKVDNSTLNCFPPIIDQGKSGACQSLSTTYYQMTHMVGLKRNLDAKNNEQYRFSPRWTYNFLNYGSNFPGSFNQYAMRVLYYHGAPSWTEVPFQDEPLHAKAWPLEKNIWLNAMRNRIDQYGTLFIGSEGVETPVKNVSDITELKNYLSKGYVFTFECSGLANWNFKKISDDPDTTADNSGSPIGKDIAYAVAANGSGGHAMTLVGYDDTVWTDINDNGKVDPGEKGALKIANSWGVDQSAYPHEFEKGDGGFIWLSYDALNRVSAVENASNINSRGYAFGANTKHNKNVLYWLTAKKYYTPELIGKFTINDNKRGELVVSLGYSDLTSTTPTNEVQFGIFDECKDVLFGNEVSFFNRGGFKNFEGVLGEYMDGTFYFDMSDLVKKYNLGDGKARRWYLVVKDIGDEKNSTVKNFELLDRSLNVLASTGPISRNISDSVLNPIFLDAAVKLMDAPKNLKATSAGQDINLSWDPVAGANEYEVSVNNGPYAEVGVNTSYTITVDPQNKNYSFKVRAGNSLSSRLSAESQVITIKGILTGDVNGDGAVNSSDYDLLYSSIYTPETTTLNSKQKVAADVNGDSKANLTDLVFLKRLMIGTINELPVPVKLINCGDVNGDGFINNSDFDLLYSHIYDEETNPLSSSQEVAADVSGDGKITLNDASLLKKFIVGAVNKFPIE